ncbi:MAG TPA: hypothetical protein VGK30_03760 [Candidatus Binatia bacterium]|jgi:hypothetical protein
MLRTLVLATFVALAVVTTPVPSRAAAPQEPTEKCDNLQDRCLHHEEGVCIVWHDECMVKKPVGHGSKRSKRRFPGAKKKTV